MTEKYYRIKAANYEFGASVLKSEDLEQYIIRFGGTQRCIDIKLYFDDPIPHMDGEMKSGQGTVLMVKSALKFVCALFPEVSGFTLKDTSTLGCKNKIKISLPHYYIAKHGMSWYMSKFDAYAEDPTHDVMIKNANKIFNKNIKVYFDEFYDKYVKRNKVAFDDIGFDIKTALKEIYTKSKTTRDFFQRLDNEYDCFVFRDWQKYYVSSVCSIPFDEAFWRIDRKAIDNWETSVSILENNTKSFLPKIKKKHPNDPFNMGGGFFPYGTGKNRSQVD